MYVCTCPGSLTLFVLIDVRPPDAVSFFMTIIYDPVFFRFQTRARISAGPENALPKFKYEDPPQIKSRGQLPKRGCESICERYDQQQSLAKNRRRARRSPTGGKRIDRLVKK